MRFGLIKINSKFSILNKALKSVLLILLLAHIGCTTIKSTPVNLPPAQEGYVDAGDGVRLFYRLLGSGPDTLVIIHGGPGFTMDYFLKDLAPLSTNRVLLFYDQRGTGRSTLASDSISLDAQRFAEDLEAIRRSFHLKRLTLMGHSWGSAVVALYAERYPERLDKIIIVGGLPLQKHQLTDAFHRMEMRRDSSTLRKMDELRVARRADPGNTAVCSAYYKLWFEPFYGNRSAATTSKGDFCAGTLESRRNKMNSVDRFTMASLGQWDWRSSLSQISAPALVIHGTMDPLPIEGAYAWATVLPNARLVQLEGIGHFPYLEVPDHFFNMVDEFLQKN